MRDAFTRALMREAAKDDRLMLVTGDLGFGVLKPFWETYPEQFVNAGIAEQSMTGLAAGLADSFIYLGGNEQSTHKYISELLGKETIDTKTSSQSKGRNGSFSQNFQQTGRELASVDELAVLDGGKCILQLRGVRPFLSEKYDITKHPNYKYLSDADRRNTFDIEKFLSTKLKVKPEETYDSYEVAVTEELSSV